MSETAGEAAAWLKQHIFSHGIDGLRACAELDAPFRAHVGDDGQVSIYLEPPTPGDTS